MAIDEIGRAVAKGELVDGRKTVATAGSAEPLSSSSVVVSWIIITAETNNTGVITVGASTVVATVAIRRGTPLYAGESATLYGVDLSEVYLDTTVNGDGVTYFYRK